MVRRRIPATIKREGRLSFMFLLINIAVYMPKFQTLFKFIKITRKKLVLSEMSFFLALGTSFSLVLFIYHYDNYVSFVLSI